MLLVLASQLSFQPHCLHTSNQAGHSFGIDLSFGHKSGFRSLAGVLLSEERTLCWVSWQMHIRCDSERTGSGRHCIWQNLLVYRSRNSPFKDTTNQWLSLIQHTDHVGRVLQILFSPQIYMMLFIAFPPWNLTVRLRFFCLGEITCFFFFHSNSLVFCFIILLKHSLPHFFNTNIVSYFEFPSMPWFCILTENMKWSCISHAKINCFQQ